jgi:hypothetical protein
MTGYQSKKAAALDEEGMYLVHHTQPVPEPDELAVAYMSGLYDGKSRRTWVGLTAQEAAECWTTSATQTWKNFEAKLKDKNT